jgi:ribosomal protein S18 acetylase RimI-like enzyme
MIPVVSTKSILDLIGRVKSRNKGYITNFYLDVPKVELWMKLNILDHEIIGETVFLCKKNLDFSNLYFISNDIDGLNRDFNIFTHAHQEEIFVIDLIGRETDLINVKTIFEINGYSTYTSLVRMNKINIDSSIEERESNNIIYADLVQSRSVFGLLQEYFDPYAEQLPLMEEIEEWAKNKRILLYTDNITIQGFLIYELIGITSYLRYWFVHPDHRDKKIGSALLRRFFSEGKNSKRQIFWVIESNDNAIKRYEHYGFKKEGLLDCIMININKSYEGKNTSNIN